jgi:hypothetical protein
MNFISNIRSRAFSISAVVKIIFAYVVKKVSKFRISDKKVSEAKRNLEKILRPQVQSPFSISCVGCVGCSYYHLHISMDLSNPSMNLIRPP